MCVVDLQGEHVQENPHTLIDTRVEYFSQSFSMVLADGVREPQLQRLAAHLWEHRIPLIITRYTQFAPLSFSFFCFCC